MLSPKPQLVWYFISLKTWVRDEKRRVYINSSKNQTAKVWVEKYPASVRFSKDFKEPRDFKVSAYVSSTKDSVHRQFGMPSTLNDNNIRPGWMANKMYDLWEEEHEKTFTKFDDLWSYVKVQEKLLELWKEEQDEKEEEKEDRN